VQTKGPKGVSREAIPFDLSAEGGRLGLKTNKGAAEKLGGRSRDISCGPMN
jgi:hypothetical protein